MLNPMLHRQCGNLQGVTVLSVSRLGKQSGMESIRPRKLLAALVLSSSRACRAS